MSATPVLLEGTVDGVTVVTDNYDEKIIVSFPYSRESVSQMHKIVGANFDKEEKLWFVPESQRPALAEIVSNIRNEVSLDKASFEQITNLAELAAQKKQGENGIVSDKVIVSDFHEQGKAVTGEIISVNSKYAAQLTGFGKDDGAAFVVLHKLSNLNQHLFKQEFVGIIYENGRGSVSFPQDKKKTNDFDENLGKSIDGVKVFDSGDGKYQVEFDYNPALSNRIQRIDGVEFNKDQKTWDVSQDKKEFLIRAVSDMRKEVAADRSDREQIEAIATQKIDDAKVRDAFCKEGQSYTGRVLAVNDRYVLQHSGKDFTTLHRKDRLLDEPKVGEMTRISYSKNGVGKIQDKEKERSQSQGRDFVR